MCVLRVKELFVGKLILQPAAELFCPAARKSGEGLQLSLGRRQWTVPVDTSVTALRAICAGARRNRPLPLLLSLAVDTRSKITLYGSTGESSRIWQENFTTAWPSRSIKRERAD